MFIKADLHTHSKLSFDGKDSVEDLLERASLVGLDAIAITDHDEIDASLVSVRITDLEDGVFYASLDINGEVTGKRSVDSRPSDAIAVGLRMKAPIMISEKLFEKAGLSESDLETSKNSDKVLSVKELEDCSNNEKVDTLFSYNSLKILYLYEFVIVFVSLKTGNSKE